MLKDDQMPAKSEPSSSVDDLNLALDGTFDLKETVEFKETLSAIEEEAINRSLESISLAKEEISNETIPTKEEPSPSMIPTSSNRCLKCQKKLRLTNSFSCKCGGIYCANCRYSNIHQCTFDYLKHAQEDLVKKNPMIQPNKLR